MSGSNAGRVCLTFNEVIKITVVMTNQERAQLCELLNKAAIPRNGKTGTAS